MRSPTVSPRLWFTPLFAACGQEPIVEPRTAFALYDVDRAASCVVTPMDAPAEPFTIGGEDGSGEVRLGLTGTTARGISGANQPSTIACTIDMTKRDAP